MPKGLSSKLVFISLVGSILISTWLGFFAFDKSEAVIWIRRFDYWGLFIASFLCAVATVKVARNDERLKSENQHFPWRRILPPTLYVLTVGVFLNGLQPKEFKIVMDEPTLVATALQMHETRESKTAATGYNLNGNFLLTNGYIDKRPALYPFLVSVLHDTIGYRPTQGFVLNSILGPLFLALLFMAGRLLWKEWGGYLSVALFATVPLLPMNMAGAGFELLNLTLLLATALVAYVYLLKPSSERSSLLVMLAVLLAQTRYESALYVLSVAMTILWVWWRQRRIEITWPMVLAPILLISIPLRRLIHQDNARLWQTDTKGVESPFSVDYISSNLSHALSYFFAFDLEQPNSWLLSALFVGALFVLLICLTRRVVRVNLHSPKFLVSSAFGLIVLINFGILMAYFWGQVDDIMATRIALPFILLQVLWVVWVTGLFRKTPSMASVLMAVIALYFVSVTRPLVASSNFLMRSPAQQEVAWAFEYVQARSDDSILFITNRYMVPLIQRRSCLTTKIAVSSKLRLDLHLRLKTFSDMLVIEFRPYNAKIFPDEAASVDAIEEHFETETITVEKLSYFGDIRVARIIAVKMDEALKQQARVETEILFSGDSDLEDFVSTLPR